MVRAAAEKMAGGLRRAGGHAGRAQMVRGRPDDARRYRDRLPSRVHRPAGVAMVSGRALSTAGEVVAWARGARVLPQNRAPKAVNVTMLVEGIMAVVLQITSWRRES